MAGATGIQGWLRRGRQTHRTLSEAGLLQPRFLASMARAGLRHGVSAGTGIAASAFARPADVGLIDDAGAVRFDELYRRMLGAANGLRVAGVGAGHNVGILGRNHRGFVEAAGAVGYLGANSLFLNTGFAAPQLAAVLDREEVGTVLYDDEFSEIVEAAAKDRPRFLIDRGVEEPRPSLERLIARHPATPPRRPAEPGRWTILTSGTTGTPKGARRSASSLDPQTALGLLEMLPMRVGLTTLVSAPIFHAWGLAQLLSGSTFSATLVLQRRFEPERVLEAIERHRAQVLVVVPVMLQRILALGPEVCGRYDTSSLEATLSSGSALPGELALRWMDTFGDNLYNFYGSTEVAQASIAGPVDLRAAPGTAGRVPPGTVVQILDENGRPLPKGETGRIFVGNASQFEGYTGGGNKQMIDGLMSVGDLGWFDDDDRLFVAGRDDDMIVSGGENVFPSEVEDLLSDHPEIAEAAVIGVEDDEFGQRLRAFVVLDSGSSLGEAEIKEHVRQQLARHKVPREVVFLDEIPRNPTGKVLKRRLREYEVAPEGA